jgi:hypothetical protein
MSMSAREQQALDSIKDGLASSDPTLVARLTMFARLASGEDMPAREKIPVGSQRATSRQVDQRLGLQGGMLLLLWFVTTVALITVALVSNRGSQDTCTGSWATFCAGGTSASGSTSVQAPWR